MTFGTFLTRALVTTTLLLAALVPLQPASAGIGCFNSSSGSATSCPFDCFSGDYLRVKAENTNGGFVRGQIYCADQSAGCGGSGSCVVTTGQTAYAQTNWCYADRDNSGGQVKVTCQAKADPSHFTISNAAVRQIVITIGEHFATAEGCVGPSEDRLTCTPVVPTCAFELTRASCWVGPRPAA